MSGLTLEILREAVRGAGQTLDVIVFSKYVTHAFDIIRGRTRIWIIPETWREGFGPLPDGLEMSEVEAFRNLPMNSD